MAAARIGSPGPARLKAPASSSTTSESVTSSGVRLASPAPLPHRRVARPLSSDFLSDKATAAMIRRTLCAQHLADRGRNTPAPVQELLPPLTSRNDVDLQLYALISIIIREFVQNWYARITPDETFVAEVIQIIAHCTRALEQRLRKIDLESLLFDELPELFDAHIRAYRTAKSSAARPPIKVNSREIYHSLCPLPALSPVPKSGDPESVQAQADNESAYRQLLVQGVLAVLLPTEDLENECLTSLVGQLFSEMIIGTLVANKVSEPWLIWEILIMVTRLVRKRSTVETTDPKSTGARVTQGTDFSETRTSVGNQTWSLQRKFWAMVQWVFLAVSSMRLIVSTMVLSGSLPRRLPPSSARPMDTTTHEGGEKLQASAASETVATPIKAPIIDFRIWPCIGNLLEMEARMPWLRGALSMLQWGAMRGPGKIAGLDGTLDRLLSHYIHVYVLDAAQLPPLLRAIRAAVFPNNAPGSSSLMAPSSDEQLAVLRRRCASALLALVPKRVGRLYYGSTTWPWSGSKASSEPQSRDNSRSGPLESNTSNRTADDISSTGEEVPRVRFTDEGKPGKRKDTTLTSDPNRQFPETGERPDEAGDDYQADMCHEDEDEDRILSEIETGVLDVFSDAYCNKHLVYGILELVLVRLIPELAERGIDDLWEERLS
ncbi:Uu.00g057780.m01.CDS01 [Anthostomella pinea]|uniref:Uu.00g057780.m01.CDS01 n=1 Tax=Anthostomella pinea TaxID=933095 RepID=A0AAI8VRT2_9PEZI|nr:Uu.00g057780.m01.CDS01 [Anthostomella pinea]